MCDFEGMGETIIKNYKGNMKNDRMGTNEKAKLGLRESFIYALV